MKSNTSLKSLLAAAALTLGVGLSAQSQTATTPVEATPPVTTNLGLLGQVYGTLTYTYVDLDDTSKHADDYKFELNQPLSYGLDGFLSYDYLQSGLINGSRVKQHEALAGLRAFSTHYSWGKPFVEAGVGYAWERYAGTKDNSFVWEVAVGTEFQVRQNATVTPYVRYTNTPDLGSDNDTWNFGVKGSYWVNSQWAVTAGLDRDDHQNTLYTVGTNFRF